MGRMHLNIMLTFAQYEREVIGERIRDKVAASRKKGMWMGGWTPLGYEVRDRKLIIHPADAERVRSIFKRFVQLKSATLLARELVLSGATKRWCRLSASLSLADSNRLILLASESPARSTSKPISKRR